VILRWYLVLRELQCDSVYLGDTIFVNLVISPDGSLVCCWCVLGGRFADLHDFIIIPECLKDYLLLYLSVHTSVDAAFCLVMSL